jgi:hypothetical protein
MRSTTSFALMTWLAAIAACSDDGLSVQNQNSSTGGAETGSVMTSDHGPEDGPGDTTSQDEGPPGGTGGTTGGHEEDGTTSAEGTGSATEGTGTTGGTEGTGTTGDTEGSSTGEPCVPITDDASAIATDCQVDADCPDGYTCQPFVGVVLQQQCQILCEATCECPMGLTCNETVDQGGVPWFQCG